MGDFPFSNPAQVVNGAQVFNVNQFGADPTGVKDSTAAFVKAFAAAAASLTTSTPGAYVGLGTGTYKVTAGQCVISDSRIGIIGPGSEICQVNFSGSGDAILLYNAVWSAANGGTQGLSVSGFTIDGTATTGTAAGLHVQDVCSLELHDLQIQNFTAGSPPTSFTTGGSSGFHFTGNLGWTERLLFLGTRTVNCSMHYDFDGTTDPFGGTSFDYMRMLAAYSDIFPGQVGLMARGFAQLDQGSIFYSYNMNAQASGANSTAVVIGPTDPSSETSRIINALLDIRGEMDGTGSTCIDLHIGAWANLSGTGTLFNAGSMTAGAVNSGSVYISGYISTPAFPNSGKLFGLPGGPWGTYTTLFPLPPQGKGMQLLDWLISSQATRVTLISGAGNPAGSGYFSNQAGDLFLRSDGGVAPNQQLYVAPGNGVNTWQPVIAAAIASGTAVLAAGVSGSVARSTITASAKIRLFNVLPGGTVGALWYVITAGTGFVIHSSNAADTSTIEYEVISD